MNEALIERVAAAACKQPFVALEDVCFLVLVELTLQREMRRDEDLCLIQVDGRSAGGVLKPHCQSRERLPSRSFLRSSAIFSLRMLLTRELIFQRHGMPYAGYLIACDAVGLLLDHFLKGTYGYERVSNLAAERGRVSLQCRECDIALGLRAFGIDYCGLSNTDGFGELARCHTQSLPNRA